MKRWMEEQEIGVDFLVNMESTCNLMSSSLCKRLGLTIRREAYALVSFNGESRKSIGTARVRTRLLIITRI